MTELAAQTSVRQACEALTYPRSSYYRQQQVRPASRLPHFRYSPRENRDCGVSVATGRIRVDPTLISCSAS